MSDIITVKNGKTLVQRHDLVNAITEMLLDGGLSFDEADYVLRLVREKIGSFELKRRPSGN